MRKHTVAAGAKNIVPLAIIMIGPCMFIRIIVCQYSSEDMRVNPGL